MVRLIRWWYGIWLDGAYYFSTSAITRKGRNLQQNLIASYVMRTRKRL